jgi:hypothetical protein
MNRIVILRLIFLGRLPSRQPSLTRRAGFYATDMSLKIIFEVIWTASGHHTRQLRAYQPLGRQDPKETFAGPVRQAGSSIKPAAAV